MERTSAIQETQVSTKIRPWKNPQKKATHARARRMLTSNSVMQKKEKMLGWLPRKERVKSAPLMIAKKNRSSGEFSGIRNDEREISEALDDISGPRKTP